MYIRANNDVIYVKQPLNFNIFKTSKNRYALKIVYATDYEDRGELTESTLDDVSKNAIGTILNSIESSDNLETLCINISKKVIYNRDWLFSRFSYELQAPTSKSISFWVGVIILRKEN